MMAYSIYLEVANSAAVGIGIWVSLVLLRILYKGYRNNETHRIYYKLTIGILIYVLGETSKTAWLWFARAVINDGENALWMFQNPILLFMSMSTVIGGLCMCRVMTSEKFGCLRWVFPLLFSISLVMWSLFGDQAWIIRLSY